MAKTAVKTKKRPVKRTPSEFSRNLSTHSYGKSYPADNPANCTKLLSCTKREVGFTSLLLNFT